MERPNRVPRNVLLRRIHGEYEEMPGLRLTCAQAQRLWGLDHDTCLGLLEELVRVRYLSRNQDGRYTRWTDHPLAVPAPRMAQATLRATPPASKRVS